MMIILFYKLPLSMYLIGCLHNRYCGACLNPQDGAETGASVYSRISSSVFWIQFITGRPGPDSGPQNFAKHGPGFRNGNRIALKNILADEI